VTPLIVAIVLLVVLASVLALAEASVSRITPVFALALRAQGHRNATLLEEIENDPARHLNAIYLAVMCAQNGSTVLVADVNTFPHRVAVFAEHHRLDHDEVGKRELASRLLLVAHQNDTLT
jgi:hypothetical protein